MEESATTSQQGATARPRTQTPGRPQRPRRLPSNLADFEVDLPPSLQTKKVDQRLQNHLGKINRNKEKAEGLIQRKGSTTVLRSCLDRIEESYAKVQETAHDVSLVSEENELKVEELMDVVDEIVETTIDAINEHLEERQDETTINSATRQIVRHISSTPRHVQIEQLPRPAPPLPNLGTPLAGRGNSSGNSRQEPDDDGNTQGANDNNNDGRGDGTGTDEDDDTDDLDYNPSYYTASANSRSRADLDTSLKIVDTLDRIAAQSDLQTPTLIFDGSSWMYPRFLQDFDRRVGSKNFSSATKMHHLVAATTSKARECIEVYQGMNGGYEMACDLLKERFGQPFQIVQSCIARLTSTTRLKGNDIAGITRFADRLKSDYALLEEMNLLAEANTQTTIKAIFDQLPPGIQSRWIRVLDKIEHDQPTFKDMVDFVTTEAKRVSHPVYQVSNTTPPQPDTRRSPRNQPVVGGARPRVSTFSSTASSLPTYSGVGNTSSSSSFGSGSAPPRQNNQDRSTPRGPSSGFPRRRDVDQRTDASNRPHTIEECVYCRRSGHRITDCPLFELKDENTRRQFVKDSRLCFTCLSSEHFTRTCSHKDRQCTVRGCTGKHHRLVHQTNQDSARTDNTHPADSTNGNQEQAGNVGSIQCFNNTMMPNVLLRVIPVSVRGKNGRSLTTFGLLDSGSTSTLMAREFALMLNLRGRSKQVSHDTVFSSDQSVNVEIADCQIRPLPGRSENDDAVFDISNLEIVPQLHIDERYKQDNLNFKRWKHLKNLCTKVEVDVPKICMLIGHDNPATQRISDSRYGTDVANQPYAVLTPFGWAIAGPTCRTTEPNGIVGYVTKIEPLVVTPMYIDDCCPDYLPDILKQLGRIETALNRLWNEERHGFSNDDSKTMSEEDKYALRLLESCVILDSDGYYIAPMLWREEMVRFPINYDVALRCLNHLRKRFAEDPEFEAMYRACMRAYIVKGYARKLTPSEAAILTLKTWLLVHHGVQNPNKPDKVRVVKNAAFEVNGISLNKQLLHGPDINNLMIGVLFRFRIGDVAINGDISDMFLRVKVTEEDSDSLRFLWWDDDQSTDEPPSVYKMTRHIFGATDSPCVCVFALQQCARDNADSFDAETIKTVLRNFYVDDVLKGVSSVDKAIHLCRQLIELLSRGNFELTKFVSNRPEVLAALPPDRVAPACRELLVDFEDLPIQRALGVKWNVSLDTFGIKLTLLDRPSTRRGCLSYVCAITDPFGAIAPVTLVAKQILQEACRRKLTWDDVLPDDLLDKWEKWKSSLVALENFSMPRCINGMEDMDDVKSVELHNFSDASESGYGTVSYLRVETNFGEVHVSLLMSKSRTAPLQFMSIPRAELQAATVSARVSNLIQRELDVTVDKVRYWTDSTITLQYIKNTARRFKTFVANRKEEILDSTDKLQWDYCATKSNPADICSRGVLGHQLMKNLDFWLTGPAFLRLSPDMWPKPPHIAPVPDEDPELKVKSLIAAVTKTAPSISEFINRYSNWNSLLTAVVWMRKFLKYVDAKRKKEQFTDRKIFAVELKNAAEAVIRVAQHECYPDEFDRLRHNKPVRVNSPLRALRPILVNGSIRVGGRLAEAPLSFDTRHPLIVPRQHHIAMLIIRHHHMILAHAGPAHTLSLIRDKYWIPEAAFLIKKFCRSCFECCKLHAKNMTQIMANLPVARLTPYESVFWETGIDCFGPLLVKRARSELKRYGMLATCLSTRAVHLELLDSMNTDAFINGLRRFIGRRSNPKTIYCDNGSNFVGGSREIRRSIEEWNQSQIERFLLQHHTDWKFQVPTASHMCGVWERLIKSVKLALKATLGDALVSEDVLRTVLIEIEAILNARPITPNSDDPDDYEALTPNHLLLHRRVNNTLPPGIFTEADRYRRQWRVVQYIADSFWKRWIKDYLPTLQAMSKWRRQTRDVKVGDLVLMVEKNVVRGHWPLARVQSVATGRDGHVRSVEVKTKDGTYNRPIHNLCLLEGSEL